MPRRIWIIMPALLALFGCEKNRAGDSAAAKRPASSAAPSLFSKSPSDPGGDPDWRAAAWALSVGGSAVVEHDGKTKTIAAAADLPAGAFKLLQLNLANREQVDDAALTHLDGLTKLEGLNLNRTKVTNAGVAKLRSVPSLRYLNLCVPELSDAAAEHLAGMPTLVSIELSYTGLTDAGLARLKALSNLETVYVAQTKVTNEGIADLRRASAKVTVKK